MTNLEHIKTFDAEKMSNLIAYPEMFIPPIYLRGYASTQGGIKLWLEKERSEGEGN